MEISLKRIMVVSNHEEEIITRIAAGEEDALRHLYVIYGQRMYAFALRLTGDSHLADDVVQDSLVAVWQGAKRYQHNSRVLTWLLGIVRNKALNILRRRTHIPIDKIGEISDNTPSPDDHATKNEQSRLLHDELQKLPLEQRSVIELVFYQGLSLDETAYVCGCPLGTVKSRLNYAKATLRGALQRAGLAAEDIR